MDTALEQWLARAIGRALTGIRGEFHRSALDEQRSVPLAVWITFDGLAEMRLHGTPDGSALSVDARPPRSIDMDEHGRIVVEDMAGLASVRACVGSPLVTAALLISVGSAAAEGIELEFSGQRPLSIVNWGDDIHVGDRLPADAKCGDLQRRPVEHAR